MTHRTHKLMSRVRTIATSRDFRSAGMMGLSGAASQAIPLLTLPLLTRLFTPEDMGTYAVWLSAVTIASLVASGRYELAAVLPDEDAEAAGVVMLSLRVLAFVVAIAAVAATTTVLALSDAWSIRLLWGLLAPTATLAMGVFQSLSYWDTRTGRFDAIARARFAQTAVTAGAGIAAGLTVPSAWTLGLSWTLGSAVAALMLAPTMFEVVRTHRTAAADDHSWQALATAYRRYPLANAPHALLDGLRDAGVLFGIRSLFGAATTGYFSVANRLTRAPASLAGQAVSQVYYRRAVLLDQAGKDLARDIRTGATIVFGVALVPTVALALSANWLVPVLLGEGWRAAGVYVGLLAPAMLSMLVVSPFTFVPHVRGRVREALWFASLDLVLKALSLLAGQVTRSTMVAVTSISAETVMVNAAVLVFYLRICSLPVGRTGG